MSAGNNVMSFNAPGAGTGESVPATNPEGVVTLDREDDLSTARNSRDHKEKDTGSIEDGSTGIVEAKSKGVIEMEIIKEKMSPKLKAVLYCSFLLLAYALSLNQYTATPMLNAAVSQAFGKHALQATIGTITSVIQAMSQPPIAKLADYYGRIKTYFGCVFCYVIGYIIVASSNGIVTYTVGNSIYILGITGLFLLQNVIISDLSSLRNRYFWTVFPNIPGAINAFVAGDIAEALLVKGNPVTQWRWGFAMFTIITPVLATPIITALIWSSRPDAQKRAEIRAMQGAHADRSYMTIMSDQFKDFTSFVNKDMRAERRAHREEIGLKPRSKVIRSFFWQLDFVGLFLFVVGFGLFFATITTANSRTARWSDAHSIAQLVIGFVVIIGFVCWERFFAPHPLLPFALLRRKTVVGACLIALFHPMGGRVVSGYLYTFLVVAAGESQKSATRMTSFPTLAGTVTTVIGGLLARYFRVLKPIIIFGICIQVLFTGLMIRFRTSTNSRAELVLIQVLRGTANGFIPFPVQAMVQAAAPHEHLAAITAGWLVVYYLSGGIGSAIGGAIWTNMVPNKIEQYTQQFNNASLAPLAYGNPFGYALAYPIGTPERNALARAQDEAQRVIVIVGTCIACLSLLSAIFLLDNYKLPDTQSMEESEEQIGGAEKERKKAPIIHSL